MKTIAVINQKGGVGKTSTALAVGDGLLLKGKKVLFVDLDPQGNLSFTMSADPKGRTVLPVLQGEATALDNIQHTAGGDLIASCAALATADLIITQTGKEYRLKEALQPLEDVYDFCIIDTPPALGILTVNALTAADGAIVPALAEVYSLQGIGQLYSTIETVKKYCNQALHIMGIVLTRYNGRAVIRRNVAQMMEQTAAQMNTKIYKTKIRECTALVEAQATRTSIYTYAPKSNAAADYAALVDEVLEDLQHG